VFLVIAIGLAIFVFPEDFRLPVIVIGALIEFSETILSVWYSRRGKVKVGPETLVGSPARVVSDCRPNGHVRVRGGEMWRARCEEGASMGDRVRVVDRRGLTLIVVPQASEVGSTST